MPMISPTIVAHPSRNGCLKISILTLRCEKRSSLIPASDSAAYAASGTASAELRATASANRIMSFSV